MGRAQGKAVSGSGSGGPRSVGGFSILCFAFVCSLRAVVASGGQVRPRISVTVRRSISLSAALPQLLRVSVLPNGFFAVFSERADEDVVLAEVFSPSGEPVKRIAGTNVATGLARLSSLEVGSDGIIWATGLIPPELGRLNQNGLVSVNDLPKLEMAYGLTLDESHGYVYVSGCVPEHPGMDFRCLLVHQFSINGLKFRKSFLETDPSVIANSQFGIQWVPLDVDTRGVVWAADAPAFTLYSIDPAADRPVSFPIHSRAARPPGKLDPLGGRSYTMKYIESSWMLDSIMTIGTRIVVSIRQPGELSAARYLLEVFDSAGVQIGMDIPAPGNLVGKSGTEGLLFGRWSQSGPVLVDAVLSERSRGHR
jgi:hypothetical protein